MTKQSSWVGLKRPLTDIVEYLIIKFICELKGEGSLELVPFI